MKVNFNNTINEMKPMHAVGQPPVLGTSTRMFHFLKEANIPYSRLHDVGGNFGGNLFVDIPNVFRDFNADENDPASYDFAFTDIIIADLIEQGCEPIYRLGVTIENFHKICAYRIFPPADTAKWARICEHIIRHYNEGWANGFHYNIKYWEIWNEPDGHPDVSENAMWKGTVEEYFELYRVTSKHLRDCFGNSIKIGGYGSCGFYVARDIQDVTGAAFGINRELTDWERRITYFAEFFQKFIDMIKAENLPFDFFSHHSYASVEGNILMQEYCEKVLEKAGFGNVEIHLNEWNTNPRKEERGTAKACADSVANMCVQQNTKMALMCYYDARVGTGVYGGLFNPLTSEPTCTYYGFKAFGEIYSLKNQVECIVEEKGVYAVAASDGKTDAVLVSNIGEDIKISTNLNGFDVYLIDEQHFIEKTDLNSLEFTIPKNRVMLIKKVK